MSYHHMVVMAVKGLTDKSKLTAYILLKQTSQVLFQLIMNKQIRDKRLVAVLVI